MIKKRNRLDESFSINSFKKSINGKSSIEIDIEKIYISDNGIIKPKGEDQCQKNMK